MGTAKHVGRVGALAAALGIGNVRRTATRMSVSIGVAVLVMATVVPVSTASASDEPQPPPDTTALILCATTCPTPDDYFVDTVKNQFIAPTHPGRIGYVKVTTPEELWPVTGAVRLLELALAPPEIGGLGGPAWPDEPWWKLSGLFDLTADQSVQAGAADLEDAIAENPNEHLVINGYSQGAGVANVVKRRLAEQYPAGTKAPDIEFVLIGDPNLPNGGWMSRFAGLYIPILDLSFNGPAPTDTQFDTVEISRKYDGFTDFPLYPLNLVADLNAVLGMIYVHAYLFDVSLPTDDPTRSPAYRGKYGDTSYYLFDNPDLPLFGPLRTLGVPEAFIDVFEPFFKVIVDLGYDRSIAPWEPTPARLIPPLDPVKLVADLVAAIGEGINNAAALIGSPPPLSIPAAARVPSLGPADAAPNLKNTRIVAKVTASDAGAQLNPAALTAPAGANLPAPTAPAAQQNPAPFMRRAAKHDPVASSLAAGNASRLSVNPRLNPPGRPVTQRPVGQPTHNVAAPPNHRRTAAGSNSDGEPRTGSAPSPTPAGSSPTAGPSGTNSPHGTDS